MSEHQLNQPQGPLQVGDQAIIDALYQLPAEDKIYKLPGEAVVTDFVGNRISIPSLPKDHWSVAVVDTDSNGNPKRAEVTLVNVLENDINVTLRGGNIPDLELRTEEDKPKALDRAKLHDRKTEQEIKFLAATRLTKAAAAILRSQGIEQVR